MRLHFFCYCSWTDELDVSKKKVFYERIKEYIDRAEQIKDRVQKHVTRGELVKNIPIDDNSTGNSYQSIFGQYLNVDVKEVLLEEPYLHEKYHVCVNSNDSMRWSITTKYICAVSESCHILGIVGKELPSPQVCESSHENWCQSAGEPKKFAGTD